MLDLGQWPKWMMDTMDKVFLDLGYAVLLSHVLTVNDFFCSLSGIYFTREMSYANKYAAKLDENKAFIIAAVIVGNAFPVTEHPFNEKKLSLLGKPVITGYQSHYTVGKCSPCLML